MFWYASCGIDRQFAVSSQCFTSIFNAGLVCVITQMEAWSMLVKSLSGIHVKFIARKYRPVCVVPHEFCIDETSLTCEIMWQFLMQSKFCIHWYVCVYMQPSLLSALWCDKRLSVLTFQGSVWASWSESMRPSPTSTSSTLASQGRSSWGCWSSWSSRSSFQAWSQVTWIMVSGCISETLKEIPQNFELSSYRTNNQQVWADVSPNLSILN